MFEPGVMADTATVGNFVSEDVTIERAANLLSDAGFDVLHVSPLMINIAGSRSRYERVFGTSLITEQRSTIKQEGKIDDATFIDTTDTTVPGLISTSGSRFEEVLEGVAVEEPCYLATPNSFPPPVDYWHLDVPADVSLGCNADKAHRGGITGRGVTVAMVDTGWQSHPWFTDRGYRVDPTVLGPGTSNATVDEHGHGTGESANVFSTAPDALLKPVKAARSSGALVNMTAAFNTGVGLNPDIITNSWTSSIRLGPLSSAMQARAAAVAAAWASGIVVVFAAGNGHWGFPGQHPDVISVGGVFVEPDGSMQTSDYSSGFDSNIYPGRRVPDVSGLVGMVPGAKYIVLPIPEGCIMDDDLSGGSHPNGDETADDDGWAAFSGTSAATPQVAGVCALIKEACAHLGPDVIREILMATARDVTTGSNAMGNDSVVGPDNSTGNGLVDANRAALIAKLRCMVLPRIPFRPLVPFTPRVPFTPAVPFLPAAPFTPRVPFVPAVPFTPALPFQPFEPAVPFQPFEPFQPFGPIVGPRGGQPLSEEDVASLEQMIIESDNPQL